MYIFFPLPKELLGPAIGETAQIVLGAAAVVLWTATTFSGDNDITLFNNEESKDGAQDKPLSKGEIKALKDAGINPEKLKGGKSTGKTDLYKKPNGDIVIKPKGGNGPGEPTGYNIKNFLR